MKQSEQINISADLLKHGDKSEFVRLIDAFSDPIYRLALNITGNTQDAEDILQETFIKVIRNVGSFQGKSSIYTWVYRIAMNEAIEVLRKGKKIETSLDDDEDSEVSAPKEIRSWDLLPEEELMGAEVKTHLERAIKQLSEKLRVVFVLRDMQGLSIQETSQLLGVSEEVVKTRLLRARLTLRESLTDYFGESSPAGM